MGPDPRTSRRRGPGEDSTARTAVARRFRAYSRGVSHRRRPRATPRPDAGCRVGRARSRLTLPNGPVISSAGRRTRRRARAGRRARLCAFRGRMSTRGPAERIAHSPDEADLSAQEAASREGARLPRPDEDGRRPSHRRRPAGPRSEATDGLTSERGTHPPRLVMLSRPQEFAALQAGTVRSHPLLTARFLRTDLETTRFGLATGRKLGGAVVRNRVRRRLREGAQGDGALVPARLGRPDHRPSGDRRGGLPEPGRDVAAAPPAWRSAGRAGELVKRIGIGLIRLYRIVFAWLPVELPLRAVVLALHGAGNRQVRPAPRQLDGDAPDRAAATRAIPAATTRFARNRLRTT